MQSHKQKRYSKRSPQWLIIWVLVVAILALLGVLLWNQYQNDKTASQTIKTNSGTAKTNANVPGSTSHSYNTNSGTSASKDQSGNYPGSTPSTTVIPVTPTGDFVSNHHPNLGGSPAPNTETSSCTTTAGVQCQIRFTLNGVTKELPAQTTDASGSTLWSNWTLQSIDLTQGTWQVSAVAINGSNQITAQDPIQLVVAP